MSDVTVKLGEHELTVYAQRHAYLQNRLGKLVAGLMERGQGLDTDGLLGFVGDSAYDVLCALIPAVQTRIPRYEFAGYVSQEAMDADEYDPEADRSPTVPEIREAVRVAIDVNGLDVLGKLGSIVDPTLLRAELNVRLVEAMSSGSANSRAENGESASTSSSATTPTSTANEGSPFPVLAA